MSLCIRCGKVYEHAKGCSEAPPGAFEATPQAKNDRALAALKEAQEGLAAAEPLVESTPRDGAKALFRVESTLTRHPSGDLTSFQHKRDYKTVEEKLKKLKVTVEEGLGDKGKEIFADLAYAKRALELLHSVQVRRREISSIKLEELSQVPGLGFNPGEAADPTDPGALVKNACEAIEKRLAATSGVDADVDAWGKQYVENLSLGEAPRSFPQKLMASLVVPQALVGTGVAGLAIAGLYFGMRHDATIAGAIGGVSALDLVVAIVLFGKAVGARGQLPQQFESVSQNFRLRLYLIAADRSLRRYVSALSQAEEAFRAHTAGDQASRWKRIKTQERDLVKALAGDEWEEKHPVDEEMTRRITAANLVEPDSIKSANGLPREVWDSLGKAYFLNRKEEGNSSEGWLASVSSAVLEKAGERDDAATARKLAMSNTRSAFAGRTTQRNMSAKEA